MHINTINNIKFNNQLINYLSVLKPAATLVLLSPTKSSLKDIIRLTLLDLSLKKVLSVQHKDIKLHPNNPYARTRTVVETCKNFHNYRTHTYETNFLNILDEESYFQLRPYLHTIYSKTPLDAKMKKKVLKQHKILNLFSVAFRFDKFSLFILNKNGKEVRNEIQRYLTAIDHNLHTIIDESPEQALQFVSFLKGNIFLLKNMTSEVLEKINKLIIQQKVAPKDVYYDLFDVFNFSEVFFTDISEEIAEELDIIEKKINDERTSILDFIDF